MTKRLPCLITFVLLLCAGAAWAQNAVPLLQPHKYFVDGSGNPCVGCFLSSYLAGTTTPTPTYTDSSMTTQNPNPVIMDATGQANVWLNPAITYKFVLQNALGTTLWTADNVSAAGAALSPYYVATGLQQLSNPTAIDAKALPAVVGSGAPVAAPAISVMQTCFSDAATCAMGSNVTSGDLLLVPVAYTAPAPTDTLATPFTLIASDTSNGISVYGGIAASSGADTITVTSAPATAVMEVSGVSKSTDITVSSTVSGQPGSFSVTASPVYQSDFVFVAARSTGTFATGGTYSYPLSNAHNNYFNLYYFLSKAAGSYALSSSNITCGIYACTTDPLLLIAFKTSTTTPTNGRNYYDASASYACYVADGTNWNACGAAVGGTVSSVVAEGDSLTFAYAPDTGSYPQFLAGLTRLPVTNMGSDGNPSIGICMIQGGCAATLSGPVTLPTCSSACAPVTVAFSPANPLVDSRGPMPVGAITVTLDGVTGSLAVVSGTLKFTPDAASGQTIPEGAALVVNTSGREDGLQVIWAGRDDFSLASSTGSGNFTAAVQDSLLGNIRAMVCNNPHDQPALVMDVTPITSPYEAAGTTEGGQLATWKTALSADSGVSFACAGGSTRSFTVLDVWSTLQGKSSGDAVDSSDVTHGYVPTSLHEETSHGTLGANITSSGTSVSYTETAASGDPSAGNIMVIGTGASEESMLVSSSSCSSGVCTVTVTNRGFGGVAGAHSSGDAIEVYDQTHFGPAANADIAAAVLSWLEASTAPVSAGSFASNPAAPWSQTGALAPTAVCVASIGYNGGYEPCTNLSAQYPPFHFYGESSTTVPVAEFASQRGAATVQLGSNGYADAWVQGTVNGAGGTLEVNPLGGVVGIGPVFDSDEFQVSGSIGIELGGLNFYDGALSHTVLPEGLTGYAGTAGHSSGVQLSAPTGGESARVCYDAWGSTAPCNSTTPTVNSGTIVGTNTSGYISVNAQTSVILTFAAPTGWGSNAYCSAILATGGTGGVTMTGLNTSATAFTFTFSAAYTGGLFYTCGGS